MLRRKGFTMIELMIVIVIVAILASVAIPMLRSRVERAKYTEAMAGCSTIATALKAAIAERSGDTSFTTASIDTPAELGFETADLQGKYFDLGSYSISGLSYAPSTGAIAYNITATPASVSGAPTLGSLVLNQNGTFTLNGSTF